MNILYINSCVRKESRTHELASALISKLGGECTELKLWEMGLEPLSEEQLEKRTKLIEKGDYSDPMFSYAKQLAEAETVVISAPYWDLSFPAELKIYIENIYVTGLVAEYAEDGTPRGLCKGKKVYYVTTAGGPYDPSYSFDYIKDVFTNYFGFEEAALIKAEMLDVAGQDPVAILEEAKNSIKI